MIAKLKSLQNNQGFMKYFKNTSWLIAERVFKMGISFFVIVFLTRYLGPEKFGILSYAQSYVGLFVAFATLGIDVILVRELTQNKSFDNKLLGTALILKLIASAIAICIIFILNTFIDDKEAVLLSNIIAIMLIFQSFNIIDTYFQANILSKFSAIANTSTFVLSSSVKAILIYLEADLVYFAYAIVFDSIAIAFGYMYIFLLQNKSLLSWKYDKKTAIYFLKNGWPLMIVTMASFIYTRTDLVMIKYLVSNEAVGNYAAAIRVSELFYFIPLLIAQSVFPKIIREKIENSQDRYFTLLEKLYKFLVWITMPIALMLFMLNDLIVSMLYGEKYIAAASILKVLSIGIVFQSIGTVNTKILYAEHFEIKYLYRSILGVIVNIALNFYLIKMYGAKGAAIATLITLFIIYYIYDLLDKDLHKYYYMKWKCFIP